MSRMATGVRLREEVLRALPSLRVSDDDADRIAYARDLWPRHHLAIRAGTKLRAPSPNGPACIAWPRNTEEVVSLVKWARKAGISLVPFGAGSGVCAAIL